MKQFSIYNIADAKHIDKKGKFVFIWDFLFSLFQFHYLYRSILIILRIRASRAGSSGKALGEVRAVPGSNPSKKKHKSLKKKKKE